mmetsp:Transcript_11134/g.27180  ORF Transcript_11134/g.27180 Transcript_11134/m.27180 type:complete len:234 (+) Transcript_11134:572-1273(+)
MALVHERLRVVQLGGLALLRLEESAAGAEAHGSPHVRRRPLRHENHRRLGAIRHHLGRVRARHAHHVARELNHRSLHAEADAEERHVVLARILRREDLALHPSLPEPAGDEDAICTPDARPRVGVPRRILPQARVLQLPRLHPHHVKFPIRRDRSVHKRLGHRQVAVAQADVLAHDGNVHRLRHSIPLVRAVRPRVQVQLPEVELELAHHRQVAALLLDHQWHVPDVADVAQV